MDTKPGKYKFQIMQAVAEILEQPEQMAVVRQERLYARSGGAVVAAMDHLSRK